MKPHILVFKGGVCSLKTACQIWRYPHQLISLSHAPHFSAWARFSVAAVWQVMSRQEEFVFCAGDGCENWTDHIRYVLEFLDNTCYSSPNAFDTRFPSFPFRYFLPPSEFRASLNSRDLRQLRHVSFITKVCLRDKLLWLHYVSHITHMQLLRTSRL